MKHVTMSEEILKETIKHSYLGDYAVIRKVRNEYGSIWEEIEISTEPPLAIVEEPREIVWRTK